MGYTIKKAGEVMKAAVIVFAETEETAVRELIRAAHEAGAYIPELWILGDTDVCLKTMPVERIIQLAGSDKTAEGYLEDLIHIYQERMRPELLLFAAESKGNELASRLSYRLGGSVALEIIKVCPQKKGLSAVRRIWGLQLEGEFLFQEPPFLISVVQGSFEAEVKNLKPEYIRVETHQPKPDWYTGYEEEVQCGENIHTYSLILAGGRGLGSHQSALELQDLSLEIHAGVGGTRPAVLNGWFSAQSMIGLSGQKVAPELCIVFGVSGCMPFMGGIHKNTFLVAVNSDPKALIFKSSDMGIVDDCNLVIKALRDILAEEFGKHGERQS